MSPPSHACSSFGRRCSSLASSPPTTQTARPPSLTCDPPGHAQLPCGRHRGAYGGDDGGQVGAGQVGPRGIGRVTQGPGKLGLEKPGGSWAEPGGLAARQRARRAPGRVVPPRSLPARTATTCTCSWRASHASPKTTTLAQLVRWGLLRAGRRGQLAQGGGQGAQEEGVIGGELRRHSQQPQGELPRQLHGAVAPPPPGWSCLLCVCTLWRRTGGTANRCLLSCGCATRVCAPACLISLCHCDCLASPACPQLSPPHPSQQNADHEPGPARCVVRRQPPPV